MTNYKIELNDSMTTNNIDSFFKKNFVNKKKFSLTIDTRQCNLLNLKKIVSVKDVLDKHRESTRKYLNNTEIIVGSPVVKSLMQIALLILKNEKPVKIKVENISF